MEGKRFLTLVGVMCLALVLVATSFMFACAKPAPSPSPSPAPAPAPAPTPAPAPKPETAADFYKKNTVTLLINSKPGGGTDYAARIFASFWGEVTGGTIVVRNEPGGNGLVTGNLCYDAKPDGLTMATGMLDSHLVGPTLAKEPGVKFDVTKFGYLGTVCDDPYMFSVSVKNAAKSIEELQKMKGLKLVCSELGGALTLANALPCEIFNLDAKVASGFRSADIALALGRGEADAAAMNSGSTLDWFKSGYIKTPLLAVDMQRSPYFPDVPAIVELTKVTPDQQKVINQLVFFRGGKTYYTTPGIPADRLQFLRDSFDKLTAHAGYIDLMKQRWPAWVTPMKGVDIPAKVQTALGISKQEVDYNAYLSNKWMAK